MPARGPIRVALVDDHHLVREGLRLVLEIQPGIVVVGEADDVAGAFVLLDEAETDVLLLDLTYPSGDAIPVIRDLSGRHSGVRVLVLTMHRDAETVRQALLAGAAGYVVKGAHSSELVQAIRAVARGELYLHSSVTDAIVKDSIHWLRVGSPLTPREREILALVASGASAVETGRALGISQHTVRRHIANLSGKLGISGPKALTRYAIEHGLIRDS